MSTQLKHLKSADLDELESMLVKVKSPHVVLNVSNVKGVWYAHLLMQKYEGKIKTKFEDSSKIIKDASELPLS